MTYQKIHATNPEIHTTYHKITQLFKKSRNLMGFKSGLGSLMKGLRIDSNLFFWDYDPSLGASGFGVPKGNRLPSRVEPQFRESELLESPLVDKFAGV